MWPRSGHRECDLTPAASDTVVHVQPTETTTKAKAESTHKGN